MKKILFFIPTLVGGGAEKVLVNLVNNLDPKKYEVSILTLFDVGINKKNINSNIKYKFIFSKVFRGNSYILKCFSPQILYRLFIHDKYDIEVAYLEGIPTRILAGKIDDNTKIIAWLHTTVSDIKEFVRPYRNIEELKWCYQQYDTIVGVSKMAIDSLAEYVGMREKMNVIGNILDVELIQKKSSECLKDISYDLNVINMITVGRLTQVKGYRRLLEICNRLYKEGDRFHLYILGEGEQKLELERYIHENNLQKNITLLGYKENPYKYISRADLFICSSYREGLSTAVAEALIVGTPIITTKCSGMNELLDFGEYGFIVDNNDEELYKGIKELIYNKEKLERYKEKAMKRIDIYKKEKVVQEIENLLDNI